MATFRVPSQYPTIAAADAAASGLFDVILLEPGYANETVTLSKNLLRITGDASNTGIVINLTNASRDVTLTGDAPFTVRGGAEENEVDATGGGPRQIYGGGGADTVYMFGTRRAGEIIDGEAGDDSLTVSGNTDLRTATLRSIEQLVFSEDDELTTLTVGGDQLRGLLDQPNPVGIVGNPYFATQLIVQAAPGGVDLSALTFESWVDDRDTITLRGSTFEDILTGTGRNDWLEGGDGDDRLIGGAGVDALLGGAGDDAYVISVGDPDTVVEAADGGLFDSVVLLGAGAYTLPANVENLAGDAGVQQLYGNDAANLILGRGGADTIEGRGGDDVIGYDLLPLDFQAPNVDGAVFDGGVGQDTLFAIFGGDYRRATLRSIEAILGTDLLQGDSVMLVRSDQFGPTGLASNLLLAGGDFYLTVEMTGPVLNLSQVTAQDDEPGIGVIALGTAAPDEITLGRTDDELHGEGGGDVLTGGGGDDVLMGGGGTDTAVLAAGFAQTSLVFRGTSVVASGPDGVDRLFGIQTVQFSDRTIARDAADGVDDLWYLVTYRDVAASGLDADDHFNGGGRAEGRNPNAYFDRAYYLQTNPDVAGAGVDPWLHFLAGGWREGRNPSAAFNVRDYLQANPDAAASGENPLLHYLRVGMDEGRSRYVIFDDAFYLASNPDIDAALVDPYLHWLASGRAENRDPHPLFDADGYLATYADVRAAGLDPLTHYLNGGWREGRDPSTRFDTSEYLAANPDVLAAGINPLLHWLSAGRYEGRGGVVDDGVWG